MLYPFQFYLKSNRHLFLTLVALIATILVSCAQIEPPPGGPEDKKPPLILAVSPADGAVDVPRKTSIQITFSKPMNHEQTEKAIFISPILFDYPEFKWSGKKLEIALPESLRKNTTYVITIGSSAKDIRGNMLGKSVSMPFSTGPRIDNGILTGKVVGNSSKVVDIWAYSMDDIGGDKFYRRLPIYITQSDSFGEFRLDYVSPGNYLVVAVEDKNKNQFWSPPSERLAIPNRLYYIDNDSPSISGINLVLADRDTLPPLLSRIVCPDSTKIEIEFSSSMDDETALNPGNYLITLLADTAISDIPDYCLFIDSTRKNIQLGGFSLLPKAKYKIECRGSKSADEIPAEMLSQIFIAGSSDTNPPTICHIKPKSANRPLPANTHFEILFSEAIDTALAKSAFVFSDTLENKVALECTWNSLNMATLRPQLIPGKRYVLKIDHKLIVDWAGLHMVDSTIAFRYSIAPADTFGELSGQVKPRNKDYRYLLKLINNGNDTITALCEQDGRFSIDGLFPGFYNLLIVADINNNGRFDLGKHDPFQFSEPFIRYPDSISIRSRWEIDIGKIEFPHQ